MSQGYYYYYYYVFILSAISPYTTVLKELFNQSDCTDTAPNHKQLTFPQLGDRGSRMTIYQRP